MAAIMSECRVNDCLLRVIRKICEGDLASNLIVLVGELGIIDCNTLLGLPLGGNQGDIEQTTLSLLALCRFKGDTCLEELTNGYEYLYSVINLRPAASLPIDTPLLQALAMLNRVIYTC